MIALDPSLPTRLGISNHYISAWLFQVSQRIFPTLYTWVPEIHRPVPTLMASTAMYTRKERKNSSAVS